jgi:hypothetical protein
VTINVVKDTEAAIKLVPGETNVVQLDSNGALVIDTNRDGGSGLNGNGTFTYGNVTGGSSTKGLGAGSGEYAFSIINNGAGTGRTDGTSSPVGSGVEASFTISLSGGTSNAGEEPITLNLSAESGTNIDNTTVSDNNSASGLSLKSGEAVFADLTIDTSDVSAGNSIDRTLTIAADSTQ